MHIDESVWAHVWKCLSRVPPPSQTDQWTQITCYRQTAKHHVHLPAHAQTSRHGSADQRLFKNAGCACSWCVRVCVHVCVWILCWRSGVALEGSNKLYTCWFLNQSPVSFNNLCIKHPPLAPPKPITDKPRRGPLVHVGKRVCVD